jgi:Ca-activated chloride channel family protein
VFPYGSEKEKWIKDVTDAFNRSNAKTQHGKTIFVRAQPMGSGETIDNILSGRLQAHLASPASAAFIKLGNAESRAKTGKDLIASTDNLVLSPVVIAMWQPMAEAIGWGKKPLGWTDILALARNPKGWQAYGYPQWGKFKFGHTHPEFSNSGLISLFAEAYAASGKTAGLKLADLEKPQTKQLIAGVEQSELPCLKEPPRIVLASSETLGMVGPWGLEPQTSTVSTYHAYKREGLRPIEHTLYTCFTCFTGRNHRLEPQV